MEASSKKSRTMNFLLEFLIITLFLALASTLCLPLLAKVNQQNRQLQAQNEALIVMESLAETMRIYEGQPLDQYLTDCQIVTDERAIITLDGTLTADYQIIIQLDTEKQAAGTLYNTDLQLFRISDQAIVMEFHVASYQEVSNDR
ncbi:hypothetical protein SDC9_106330 [bioreactor metagenome]|uniref:Uncharacterized protein n=1 Tax=bioreactor metagenome TaxID=1076179 RepID=A0A645B331_9ZZZZ|nr:hypothetical protein [Erysipelotrichaceae bacterium]